MGNDSYALGNMNFNSIPTEPVGNKSPSDEIAYFDKSTGSFKKTTVPGAVEALTATAAVTKGAESIELNHATVVIAATAVATNFEGFLMVKNTSASGTAAHKVTLTGGTWDGTNTVVTLNAPNEAILVYMDSAGDGTIIENVGSVALS